MSCSWEWVTCNSGGVGKTLNASHTIHRIWILLKLLKLSQNEISISLFLGGLSEGKSKNLFDRYTNIFHNI